MVGHLYLSTALACEDVKGAVGFPVELLASDDGSDLGVVVNFLQRLSVLVHFVIKGKNVEGTAALVFLAGLVEVSPHNKAVILLLQVLVHHLEAGLLAEEAVVAGMVDSILLLVKALLAHGLLGDIEVFVETLGLGNKMSRYWIWAEHLR